jgi:hypothetical protein
VEKRSGECRSSFQFLAAKMRICRSANIWFYCVISLDYRIDACFELFKIKFVVYPCPSEIKDAERNSMKNYLIMSLLVFSMEASAQAKASFVVSADVPHSPTMGIEDVLNEMAAEICKSEIPVRVSEIQYSWSPGKFYAKGWATYTCVSPLVGN